MINPGLRSYNYISAVQSPYHVWFQALGYPELDVFEYPDGQWEIMQYLNSPIIPCLTRWQTVLGPMQNVEINFGFCEKYAKSLDMNRREYWAKEEEKSKACEDEWAASEKHSKDLIDRAHNAFMRNPNVLERIAKNGTVEMNLSSIAKHVPKSEYRKPLFKGKPVGV